MEEELFYRLFTPLKREQEKDVLNTWENSKNEDIYIRAKEVEKYCNENYCDFLFALCHIYVYIEYIIILDYYNDEGKYESKCINFNGHYFTELDDFLNERIIKYVNKGKPITDEQKETLNDIHNLLLEQRNNFNFNKSDELSKYLKTIDLYITLKNTTLEEKVLRELIEMLSEERQNNPQEYLKDKLKINISGSYIDMFIKHMSHTKEMYYPISKIKTNNETPKDTNDITDINSNSKSNSSLQVGLYDEIQTKILHRECNNVVFKHCKIEDFVNSLNNPDKCNLEVKNKNLLYVLYNYFFNFFDEEGDVKIEKLNEKFEIPKERYDKKKYREESPNATNNQKKFDEILAKV